MKRYQDTGTQPILDNRQPGETWDGVMDEGQERFLLGIGALRIISSDVKADKRITTSSNKASRPRKKA